MSVPKIQTITLGCRFNFYETEAAKSIVERMEPKDDVVIINTCAVTHEAERQSKQAVRKAVRENTGARVIVTGCAATTAKDYFNGLDGVTVIENSQKSNPRAYSVISHKSLDIFCDGEMDINESDELFANRVRAFLPIQNGCNHFCTYCIVPYTRGRSVSVPLDVIIRRVNHFISVGFKEVVLSGIDITSYKYEDVTLAGVIKKIMAQTSLERLRISSLDPAGVDETLLDIITSEPRVMPHFHLSIQSGDNDVLKAMRRRHTREDVIKLCSSILEKRPEVVFGSDFIAGFPTETEAMFESTLKLVDEAHLSLMHVFPFSPRAGTVAAQMIQLPRKAIHERAHELRKKSTQAKSKLLRSLVGTQITGMVEKTENGIAYGKTKSFIPFTTPSPLEPRTVINGTIIGFDDECLQITIT